MADNDVIGGLDNLIDAVSGETPAYQYKDPNTDMMKAISKCVDAATGETGTEYTYKDPNTDVIQKMDELAGAIAESGGGGGDPAELWILDPVKSAAIYAAGKSNGAYVNAIYKARDNQSGGGGSLLNAVTFGGTLEPVVSREGVNAGGFLFATKITAGVYKTLHFECMVNERQGSRWRTAYIHFLQNLDLGSDGMPSALKTVMLADIDWSVEQINTQEGVVINSTSNVALSAQTVEVDISGLTTDFYIGFGNCDLNVYVRGVYLTKT